MANEECTNLANCSCLACVDFRLQSGFLMDTGISPTVSKSPSIESNQDQRDSVSSTGPPTDMEGWLMIKADGKSKIFRKAFKKFYVVVDNERMIIKKGRDGKVLKELNIASSLLAFQKDKKNGEYIRIANADDVFEVRPESSKAAVMNEWKECLQIRGSSSPAPKPIHRGGMRSSMFLPSDPQRPKSNILLTAEQPNDNITPSLLKAKQGVKKDKTKFLMVTFAKETNQAVGLRICGGIGGDPNRPEIRVLSIVPGSIASTIDIQVGDEVVHVNHRKLEAVTVQAASKILQKSYGVVSLGLARKLNNQSVDMANLPSLHDAEAPLTQSPPPAETEEVFGFPASDGDDEDVAGFGGFEETPRKDMASVPESPIVDLPTEPKPEPTASPADDARAERLRKMKEARAKRRNSVEIDLTQILAWIDNLDEENC